MKILMQHLEFSFGSLNGDYSEQTLENFEYMFNRLEEDNLGYVHFDNVSEFYSNGITNEDKRVLKETIIANSKK